MYGALAGRGGGGRRKREQSGRDKSNDFLQRLKDEKVREREEKK